MNRVFTAPEIPLHLPLEYFKDNLFLAGSISGAEDWHKKVISYKDGALLEHYNIFNPRRKHFDVSDLKMEEDQISWEFQMINQYCKNILFWFSWETVAPITLYEYGRVLANYRHYNNIFVGVHPDYKRKRDVEIQTRLALDDPSFKPFSDLEKMCDAILLDKSAV